MFYLARRKDYELLKSPPQTHVLPRAKVDQASRDLNQFKKLPKPKSHNRIVEHNSEQFYLEKRLYQIQQETEKEQKSYYLACKERDIAWSDYRDLFFNSTLLEKLFSPARISDLKILRTLYLEAENKVELELGKFSARTRVREHEEKVKQQRETEIEEKTKSQTAQNSDIDDIPEETGGEQLNRTNQPTTALQNQPATPGSDIPNESIQKPKAAQRPQTDNKPDTELDPAQRYFGQNDFSEKYPNFEGLTYIDESFSIKELELSSIQNANFSGCYFVSVVFRDPHQFNDCEFMNSDLSFSNWPRSDSAHRLLACDFTGASFNNARFEYTAFYNCCFDHSDFTEITLKMVKFVNCSFENCKIIDVDFSNSVMSADMLEKIDFQFCSAPPRNKTKKEAELNQEAAAEEPEDQPQE